MGQLCNNKYSAKCLEDFECLSLNINIALTPIACRCRRTPSTVHTQTGQQIVSILAYICVRISILAHNFRDLLMDK